MLKFSVVITTYNRLSLLKRAIATALAQTVSCEVVVVDDCSADETESTISSWAEKLRSEGDERLKYHRNSENLGHSKSVNTGVALASGDWVKFLDDDDYLAPNCIAEMIRAIALCPQAVICSVQAAQVDEDENTLSITRQVGSGKAFYIPQEDIHYGMLLEQVPFGTPVQVACRRDAFLKTGGWDSSLDANFDDIDSWIKIAQFGDAVFINQCLTYRTVWSGSFNQKFALQTRLATNILIKEKIYALVNSKYRNQIPRIEDIRKYLQLHWSLVALKKGDLFSALQWSCSASFSPTAWKLLIARTKKEQEEIPQVLLIN